MPFRRFLPTNMFKTTKVNSTALLPCRSICIRIMNINPLFNLHLHTFHSGLVLLYIFPLSFVLDSPKLPVSLYPPYQVQ